MGISLYGMTHAEWGEFDTCPYVEFSLKESRGLACSLAAWQGLNLQRREHVQVAHLLV
jgi:hypothetical protein